MSTPFGTYRIGDAERADAISALSHALGEGRLTMAEFDERCEGVAKAQFFSDLTPLFADLPCSFPAPSHLNNQAPAPRTPPVPVSSQPIQGSVAAYSAEEIHHAYRRGRKTRAGIFWLGTTLSLGSVIALTPVFHDSATTGLPFFIIPVLYILLYVMKVGPAEWYTPSVRELEKRRRELIRVQQLELEAARAHEIAAQRIQRKQQVSRMTTDAIDIAQRTVSRFTKK